MTQQRKPFHVFERNPKTGDYKTQVYAPLESVIAYLRVLAWNERTLWGGRLEVLDPIYCAIEICNNIANGREPFAEA